MQIVGGREQTGEEKVTGQERPGGAEAVRRGRSSQEGQKRLVETRKGQSGRALETRKGSVQTHP